MSMFKDDMGPVVRLPKPTCPEETAEYTNPAVFELEEIGSFERYCVDHFCYEWVSTLGELIANKRVPIDKEPRQKINTDHPKLKSAYIQRMEFARIDRTHFYADAVVPAEIEFAEYRDGAVQSEIVGQWYRLRHIFEVQGDGYSYEAVSATIYDKSDTAPGLPLSKYLIPILDAEMMEQEAERILEGFYPKALMEGKPVFGQRLAENMGINVECVWLLNDKHLMGKMLFKETDLDTCPVPGAENRIIKRHFYPPTIIMNGCGGDGNAICIHESIHYFEHDLFIWAQSLYREDVIGFDCPKTEFQPEINKKSPVYWAELQARQMTYKVLMNRKETLRLIDELSRKWVHSASEIQMQDEGKLLEWLITQTATHFKTSKQSARNRLKELGYGQARGVLNYVDGKYIPPFFYSDGILERNQTFLIRLKDAVAEFERNEKFRELITNGYYIYVEGRFCQNLPQYIRRTENGEVVLTAYARENTEVCCLRFEVKRERGEFRYHWGEFHAEKNDTGNPLMFMWAAEPGLASPGDFDKMVKWITATRREIASMTFEDALVHLMKKTGVTNEELEYRTGISVRTITRLRANELDERRETHSISKGMVIAIGIALHLPAAVTEDLLAKASLMLSNSYVDNVYRIIINTMYPYEVSAVNEYLVSLDMEPLIKERRRVAAQ